MSRRATTLLAATAGGVALLSRFHTTPQSSVPVTVAAGTSPLAGNGSGAPTVSVLPGTGRSADGPVINTRYGPVQVRVTVQGKTLIDVQALELPSDRTKSARISQQAGPLLRSEALQAQSANIHAVSGASYTSAGYVQSLQGALDRAAG